MRSPEKVISLAELSGSVWRVAAAMFTMSGSVIVGVARSPAELHPLRRRSSGRRSLSRPSSSAPAAARLPPGVVVVAARSRAPMIARMRRAASRRSQHPTQQPKPKPETTPATTYHPRIPVRTVDGGSGSPRRIYGVGYDLVKRRSYDDMRIGMRHMRFRHTGSRRTSGQKKTGRPRMRAAGLCSDAGIR